MNSFAFKCTKCGAVDYSNTIRRVSMRCSKCGAFNMVRSAKNDRGRNGINYIMQACGYSKED